MVLMELLVKSDVTNVNEVQQQQDQYCFSAMHSCTPVQDY